jgi:hypothetical protein
MSNSLNFNHNFKTLFKYQLSNHIDKEYIPYIEDVVRMLLLQSTIQFMYFIKDPANNKMFTFDFIELILYVIIGVSVYWLVFKKMVLLK